MKKLLFLLALVGMTKIGYGQQAAATPAAKADLASFQWTEQAYDFGKIKQGTPSSHEFKFTNTGKVPLVIANVQASCGCTTPDWTKVPVAPGQQGFIKATYNAASTGIFSKTVTVTANVEPASVQLSIKGEVVTQVP
jgi:hypothetical protein